MDRRTFCRMVATGGSIGIAAGLAGCVFGEPPSGDLGEITGDWPMTGKDLGHTRCVEAGPTEPDTVWVTDLDDAVRAAATPALAAGRLYVPADAVSERARYRHRLYALTAATGDQRWQVPLRADLNAPPAVSGNRIVVSAQRDVEEGRVVAFDDRYGEDLAL
jgi:outer membrane protein assembly factor BamB